MPNNLDQATKNREAMAEIKRKYLNGKISHSEAKQLAQPIIDLANERCVEIAKKHGKKPYKLSFTSLMRDSY